MGLGEKKKNVRVWEKWNIAEIQFGCHHGVIAANKDIDRPTRNYILFSSKLPFLVFSFLLLSLLPFISMAKTVPFHLKEYWEDRFEKEEHFEWLADWPILKPLVEPFLHPDEPILHIGKCKSNNECISYVLIVPDPDQVVVTRHLDSILLIVDIPV